MRRIVAFPLPKGAESGYKHPYFCFSNARFVFNLSLKRFQNMTPSSVNAARTVAELQELRALTADEFGAQRLAWSPVWEKARAWLREKLEQLPVTIEIDEAGNLWATLKGHSEKEVWIGSHIDSVPNGGWLDGCLGVLGALEALRRVAAEGTPAVTVRLVDWADEEGARFGYSLMGSRAAAGNLKIDEMRILKDKQGNSVADVLAGCGVTLDRMNDAHHQFKHGRAYIELHIEQGPVLESLNLPLGVVLGTVGLNRKLLKFTGQNAHAGATPMHLRRDPFLAAARFALEVREIAKRHNGVGTTGNVVNIPGIYTAVARTSEITLDQRHLDADHLAAMLSEAEEAASRIAAEEKVTVEWTHVWHADPAPWHPDLIGFAEEAVMAEAGVVHKLPSGPLHDATAVAETGIPTIMLFTQSLKGLSHTNDEDTRIEHVEMGVRALDRLVGKTIEWVAAQ
jgi:N-carbamoyl-L-amino-acid hydrolase